MDACYLYRLYNDAGEVIYIGCTMNPWRRIKDHLRTQPWADEIAHHDVEGPFPTPEALYRERTAISAERPRHNRAVYPPRWLSATNVARLTGKKGAVVSREDLIAWVESAPTSSTDAAGAA